MQLSPIPPQRNAAPMIIPQDRAVYRIKEGKFFGPDDYLYNEGEVIAYDSEPNQEMEPLNAKAHANMRAYLKRLDEEGRKAAEKAGRGYTSLADAYENAIAIEKQDAKKVQVIGGAEMKPILRAKRKDANAVARLTGETEAPLTGTRGKLSVGAPAAAPVAHEKQILNGDNQGI